MSSFALLPAHLAIYEVWLTRLFLFLGIVTLAPWLLLIAYDFAVYVVRVSTYELPYVGGRARGVARPRAPSLGERSPRLRAFSRSVDESAPGSSSGSGSGTAAGSVGHNGSAAADELVSNTSEGVDSVRRRKGPEAAVADN